MNILVVEDERMLSESLCELLTRHGFTAEAAYDGPSGLEFALTGVYDLIVLDVMLPGFDGFELARCLFSAGGRNVSKETLLIKVWGWESEAVDNNVEVCVGFLRRKLEAIGSLVRIKAQRSLGYHLEAGT